MSYLIAALVYLPLIAAIAAVSFEAYSNLKGK